MKKNTRIITTTALVLGDKPVRPVPSLLSRLKRQPSRNHRVTGAALLGNSLHTLQSHRMRSLLNIVGITIGIAAVIAVVCLVMGVNGTVNLYFTRLGADSITIVPSAISSTYGVRPASGSGQTLTLADSEAIATQVPGVVAASPILNTSAQVISEGQNWYTPIQGVYPDYQTIAQWQLDEGSWINDQQEQMGAPVAVLGQTVATQLFGSLSPINQTIRVRNQLFRVIGTLQPRGFQGTIDSDNIIFVPFSAAIERLKPSSHVDQIQAEVDSHDDIVQDQIQIISLLRTRHHLIGDDPVIQALEQQQGSFAQSFSWLQGKNPTAYAASSSDSTGTASFNQDDFQVLNNSLLVQTAQQDANILEVLLIGIATITLTVGGIGIMNIMLISVGERTAEIGLCMAIGARQCDIRTQFLLETLVLSLIGGGMGLLLGLMGGFGLTNSFGFPFILSLLPIVAAIAISALVGIVFGLYPAMRASRLDPIVALRAAF
jgi:putative ABC transport system permease protein